MSSHSMSPILRYPLLVPYIIRLCIRYGVSPTVIIHANPALPYGGLPFGPKDEVSDRFDGVLRYRLIKASLEYKARLDRAADFADNFGYPIIVKPNLGHRGVDIHLAKDIDELASILSAQTWDFLVQQYCDYPHEYGIFYCRMPGETEGEIISLTEKIIPVLIGDGVKNIEGLIKESNIENKKGIQEELSDRLYEVPGRGEKIKTLVGAAHARGSMFFDVAELETVALRKELNRICNIEGFSFGRLDVKSKSPKAFRRGEFKIIEINGSTSECIHIYDPSIPFREGMRVLRDQWKRLFVISAFQKPRRATKKREIGMHASNYGVSFLELLRLYRKFYRSTKIATGKPW